MSCNVCPRACGQLCGYLFFKLPIFLVIGNLFKQCAFVIVRKIVWLDNRNIIIRDESSADFCSLYNVLVVFEIPVNLLNVK